MPKIWSTWVKPAFRYPLQGFQFDFTNAQLSVQDGYVSILANVRYAS